MFLALVYYPDIQHDGFHAFRKKYEPYAGLLPPHVTFVYPVPEDFGQQKLSAHISKVVEDWTPFKLHFQCKLELTWDNWMKLVAEEGHNQVVELHDQLYTGILKPHLRPELPYNAYIGIGLFSNEGFDFNNIMAKTTLNKSKYERAKQEFEALNFNLWCQVDQLTMVRVNEDFTKSWDVEVFEL